MTFLIVEIFLYLLAAFCLGGAVGWIVRNLSAANAQQAASAQLDITRTERDQAQEALEEVTSEHKACGPRFQEMVTGTTRLEGEVKEAKSRVAQLEADLKNGVEMVTKLRDQLSAQESKTQGQRALYDKMQDQYEKTLREKKQVEGQFKDQLQKSRTALAEVKESRRELSEFESRLDQVSAARDAALGEVQSLKLHIAGLQTDLDAVNTNAVNLDEVSSQASRLDNEVPDQDTGKDTISMSSSDQEIYAELARSYTELKKLKEQFASVEEELVEANTLIVEMQAATGEMTRPTWILDNPSGSPDDLKRIKGIGPKLEKTLNELGIYHFSQLSQMGYRDIAWLTECLDTFPGRIARDRWVEQARTLED